jgi:hypothetical protein
MKHTILDPKYEAEFIDDSTYAPDNVFRLRGMAAAIQDSSPDWRPRLSELVALLSRADRAKVQDLVDAGASYGFAKQNKDIYPGPALLFFGAAINAIGENPDVELTHAIDRVKPKLEAAKLLGDPDIKKVLAAAQERAQFDKVSEMLRQEFSEGLRRTGKYTEEKITEVVKKIVNTTHQSRHKGLIDRFGWAEAQLQRDALNNVTCIADDNDILDSGKFTSLFLQMPGDGETIIFGKSFLQRLIPYAQDGCAQAILKRLEPLRHGT